MEGMFEIIKVEFEQNNKVQTKYTLDVSYDLFCEDYFHLRAYTRVQCPFTLYAACGQRSRDIIALSWRRQQSHAASPRDVVSQPSNQTRSISNNNQPSQTPSQTPSLNTQFWHRLCKLSVFKTSISSTSVCLFQLEMQLRNVYHRMPRSLSETAA